MLKLYSSNKCFGSKNVILKLIRQTERQHLNKGFRNRKQFPTLNCKLLMALILMPCCGMPVIPSPSCHSIYHNSSPGSGSRLAGYETLPYATYRRRQPHNTDAENSFSAQNRGEAQCTGDGKCL